MSNSLEPLDPRLRRLFDRDDELPDTSTETADRIWGRVASTIAVPPPGGGAGGDSGGGSTGGAGSVAPPAAGPAASGLAGALATPTGVGVIAAVFAAGAAAGGFTVSSLQPPAQPSAVAITSASHVPPSAKSTPESEHVLAPDDLPLAPVATSATASASSRPSPVSSGAIGDPELARERALISQTRTTLMRNNPKHALGRLGQHERQFSTGRMRAEREALRVVALRAAGRTAEAQARSEKFAREHPNSLFARPATSGDQSR